MTSLITIIKQTWKTYWQNKKEIPIAVISDFMFYYFLALLSGYVMNRMLAAAEQIMNTVGDLTSATAMQSTQIIPQYKEVSRIMWMLFGGILLIWIVFKGISWWHAQKTLGERINPKEFIKRFALISLFFYAAIILLVFFSTYAQYRIYFAQTAGTWIIGIITLLLLIQALYFGTIAYSIIERNKPIRTAFILGIKKWKHTAPPFALSTIAFAISGLLFYFLLIQNTYVALGAALLAIMPAIHYCRLLMINSIKKVKA